MFAVERGVDWPGGRSRSDYEWDALHDIVASMKIDEAIAVEMKSERECKTARDSVHNYTKKKLDCISAGWKLETTIKKTTLYIRKVLI